MPLTTDGFKQWVQSYGPQVSAGTAVRYAADVGHFLQHVGDPTPTRCRFWYEMQKLSASPSTINRKLAALRAYVQYAQQNHWLRDDPFLGIQMQAVPKRLPRPVEHDDILTLLRYIRAQRANDAWAWQDVAFVELLYGTGLRLSEAAGLTLGHLASRESITVIGKGNKERATIMTDAAYDACVQWTAFRLLPPPKALVDLDDPGVAEALFHAERRRAPTASLFYSLGGRPLAALKLPGHPLYLRMVEHCAAAGIAAVPHRLRHSFGTELLNGGADLYSVSQVMGHSNVQTTRGYAELNRKGLRAIRTAHTRQKDD